MGKKKYVVKLTKKQQKKLRHLTRKGESKARQLTRARVLLLSDENRKKGPKTDDQISEILDVSLSTIIEFCSIQGVRGKIKKKVHCRCQ